ncbi:MAG TPA: diaminopimelate decarboxylase, partial [Thermodesulfobacteriota bacterium]|nr:diaminopimelate decarboxylase [Thermodesulfobacteriota bacterium]
MDNIDGFHVNELAREFGSPLFVASATAIIRNCRGFGAAFSAAYPNVAAAYSYKVNSVPALLGIIHGEGLWAEAASGFEYALARRMGVPGSSIVLNGPYKTKEELKEALKDGAIINADHFDELDILEEIAREE